MAPRPDPTPLPAAELALALERAHSPWRDVRSVGATGSTNADLAALVGAAEGTVIVADLQTAGRGRLGRSWTATPGTALTFSTLLRPAPIDPGRRSWVPLLVGLAVRDAVAAVAGLHAILKWPNDLLVDEAKFAGILCEVAGDAVVAGVGINVTVPAVDLPPDGATSLALAGAGPLDRCDLLAAVLVAMSNRMVAWRAVDGDIAVLRAEYLQVCTTVGRRVTLRTAGGAVVGTASDVDELGRLIVDGTPYAAGDVSHVRPA